MLMFTASSLVFDKVLLTIGGRFSEELIAPGASWRLGGRVWLAGRGEAEFG